LFFSLLLTNVAAYNSQPSLAADGDNAIKPEPDAVPDLLVAITISDKRSTTDQYTRFEMKKGNITSKSHMTYALRLHLTLKLNFTNVGKRPILLYKNSKIVPDWAISRSEKESLSNKYESQMTSDYIADEDFRRAGWRDDEPQIDQFIILAPGESQTLVSPYSFVPSDHNGKKLKPGTYFLQLWIQTWYYYADAKMFRERWRDKGYVWSELMKPKPIALMIER